MLIARRISSAMRVSERAELVLPDHNAVCGKCNKIIHPERKRGVQLIFGWVFWPGGDCSSRVSLCRRNLRGSRAAIWPGKAIGRPNGQDKPRLMLEIRVREKPTQVKDAHPSPTLLHTPRRSTSPIVPSEHSPPP